MQLIPIALVRGRYYCCRRRRRCRILYSTSQPTRSGRSP